MYDINRLYMIIYCFYITVMSYTWRPLVSSFIPDISIEPLQVHYYSEALPTTALILCQS